MTNGPLHKFLQLTGLTNFNEGSVMFKNGTQYFLAYSNVSGAGLRPISFTWAQSRSTYSCRRDS